ncbi:T9SS type A sorting domain-containing protein [Fluviicola taffensis]|nr:T9SS type A sorting domain-containing protein [Fluviicola taffensis]
MNRILTILIILHLSIVSFSQSVTNDLTFNPLDIGYNQGYGADDEVYATAVQTDGKVIIGGDLYSVNLVQLRIARLHTNGSVDTSFHPPFYGISAINDLKIQNDGKIIAVGNFVIDEYGLGHRNISRLNSDGSVDSTFQLDFFTNGSIRNVLIQPDGRMIIAGNFQLWSGAQVRNHIARILPNGLLDTTFISSGTDYEALTIALQNDGKILLGGVFSTVNGSPLYCLARLDSDGSLDSSFPTDLGIAGQVKDIAVQSDGKIMVTGSFTSFNGSNYANMFRLLPDGTVDNSFDLSALLDSSVGVSRVAVQSDDKILMVIESEVPMPGFPNYIINSLVRLNSDGAEDNTFTESTNLARVYSLSVQTDGKIIVGGSFSYISGVFKNNIARLESNGLLDLDFNRLTGLGGPGTCSILQPDGKIVVAGNFRVVNTENYRGIVRLESNGEVDTSFQDSGIGYPWIRIMKSLPDGKILIIGDFHNYQGVICPKIARLHPNGAIDTTFISPFQNYSGTIYTLSLQSDGKIVVAGDFNNTNSSQFRKIARLLPSGSFDMSFNSEIVLNERILTSEIQSDGKIIIGGSFTIINTVFRFYLARLLPNGDLDNTYNISCNAYVSACKLQPDGKLIIGGYFDGVNNLDHKGIARINEDGTLDNSFQTGNTVYSTFIQEISVFPSGKILVCGAFSTDGFLQLNNLARFQANGELDYTFNTGTGPNLTVNSFEIQPDEKIIICGSFSAVDDIGRNSISRLEICQSTFGPDTSVTECGHFTWTNGITYNQSGSYIRIIPNNMGCDSILRLNLTLNNNSSTTNITSCGLYTWTNEQTYFASGSYDQTLVNSAGCDSSVNLNLTVLNLPNAQAFFNNGTMSALGGSTYQWINCTTNSLIPEASSNMFIPSENGSYAVIVVNVDGCSDTSDCVSIMDLGVGSYTDQEFSVMPNPTNDQVHINFSGSDAELTVYDLQGKVVLKDQIQNQGIISLQNFERGVYLFDFKNSQGHSVQRVVKQ